jgi:asparagine synthase (glutamine-hydrolysing)
MCGIAGFTGWGDERIARNMIQAINYRGPDSTGVFAHSEFTFAFARLAIIDLRPEGNQPMMSADNRFIIVFNGEIYNYQSLRKELEPHFSFRSLSDTEVLLNLYARDGVNMLQSINGMFAFAIYDFEKKELFVARDRMGKKPLYYTATNNSFVFASELKALLQHPSVTKKLNIEAVNQYLTFDYVPTPSSIVQNVFKLEAGNYLIVKDNQVIKKQSYWEHDFSRHNSISFTDAVHQLDVLLNDAVKSRLMSDVPLGVFLSGGLDSSAVAYYAQKNSTQKIKTFSIGFENKSYDEASYALQVSKHLSTDHYTEILSAQQTLDLMDEILPLVDEPFADASLIPTYFLSKHTRHFVTVALGGDGSDELMAGYPTFISNYFKGPFANLPKPVIRTLMSFFGSVLKASDKNISLDFKISQFLRGFLESPDHIHQLWLGSFVPGEKKALFLPEVYSSLSDKSGLSIIDNCFKTAKADWTDFEKTSYYYYQTYLQDDILVKVDRASMYNSLEVRAPFLDKNVVEFLNSLPRKYKQKGLESKHILKKLMEGKLPDNIIYRPKKGFGIPLSHWIRHELKGSIQETLLDKDELFDKRFIEKIFSEHQSKKANHRKLIWNLFVLKKFLSYYNL